ncbi:MAG: hypothetical protein O2888_01075 [Chloroflexi bacterium]|nr:hypothetical protein [Chloroflexota bacterium]MQC17034.1 hypothetical protein [Chloroflexota bacterium]
MRIGIDFDDTLSDWGVLLTEEARRRWDIDLSSLYGEGTRPEDRVGVEPWRQLILDVLQTDLSLSLPLKPGAREVTNDLAGRHELIIVTARYDHEAVFVDEWVRMHNLPIRSFVATGRQPKDGYALDLGLRVHFDDTARDFDSFVGHPCQGALLVGSVFDRGDEPGAHVRSVESWHRFADFVREIEEQEARAAR